MTTERPRVKVKIRETLVVRCPYARAPQYLNQYFLTLRQSDAGPAILRLELPLEELGIPGGMVVGRDVTISLAAMTWGHTVGRFLADERFEHVAAVVWEPANGGPFPVFRGFLSVQADRDYSSCKLVLEGDYRPPFGIAGHVFDAVLGRHIARATARDLLRKLERVLLDGHQKAGAIAR